MPFTRQPVGPSYPVRWLDAPAPVRPLLRACRRLIIRPTQQVLVVQVQSQRMHRFELQSLPTGKATWLRKQTYVVSTSRIGYGQLADSLRTPLGLHQIARKLGGGLPIGTAFKNRIPTGLTWQGLPSARIAHRILWLAGLEPGFNSGANVDSFHRYIYIHGTGDETTLGRPDSCGCIHMSANDLIPLFDNLPVGVLAWISAV